MVKANTGSNLGFGDKLWAAADKLCGDMNATNYMCVILSMISLNYITPVYRAFGEMIKLFSTASMWWCYKTVVLKIYVTRCCRNSWSAGSYSRRLSLC